MIRIAQEAARRAAAIIHSATRQSRERVMFKGAIDLVTEVDLASEAAIREHLARETPEIPVLAEEHGGTEALPTCWIVDPLDGTTNFVHGYPFYAVSIALKMDSRLELGCILDLVRGDEYTATRGHGAFHDGDPIHVSRTGTLDRALLLTGFPYDRRERSDFYLAFFKAFLECSQGIRRGGAAALDMVRIARGEADAFWEFGLKAWDVAAGTLLIQEAGGTVTGMDGEPLDIHAQRFVASNSVLHGAILKVIQEVFTHIGQERARSAKSEKPPQPIQGV